MKNIKNVDFYEKVIYRYEEHLKLTEEKITNFPPEEEWETRPHKMSSEYRLQQIKLVTFTARLQIIIASYSKGDDKNSLRNQFSEAVKVMQEVWDKRVVKMHMGKAQKEIDVYYIGPTFYMRWMLSLGVLLEVPDDEFQILIDLVKRDHIKDALYDICIKTKIEDWQISDMVRPLSPKNKIIDIINEDDKIICEKLTKNYLGKHWFKTFKNWGGWQTTDVSGLDVNSDFVGFWAFEVAAVVKIKGLDDSSFKDNRFYPDRLV
ncbi:PoNe immunity protein domain-containing protein [Psychroflexus tropicus]|uniref:PoNe immunity protein domain-containing protein n=1 Tax=Psychroflexus tropicus TaxID=197345 RepID=UPI000365B50B|nr:PoNe immunity protein domain-containing protein [Psychroflexus tropicus]